MEIVEMRKKTEDQENFEKHYWGLIPQNLLTPAWNHRYKSSGNYSDPFTAAAYSCWLKSAELAADKYKG